MNNNAGARAIMVAAVVGVAVVILSLLGGLVVIVQGRNQSRTNGQMMKILVATSGCSIHDSPDVCAHHQADVAKAQGLIRVADVDCRIHRAAAGMPAVDPSRTCQEQTPPNVYPGGTP